MPSCLVAYYSPLCSSSRERGRKIELIPSSPLPLSSPSPSPSMLLLRLSFALLPPSPSLLSSRLPSSPLPSFSSPHLYAQTLRCVPLPWGPTSPSPHSSFVGGDDDSDDIGRLLELLPSEMQQRVAGHPERNELVEIVMDLGRKPVARFPSGDFSLSDRPISAQDILHATSQVSILYSGFTGRCNLLVEHFLIYYYCSN